MRNGPLVAVQLGHEADYVGMEDRRPAAFPNRRMLIDTGAAFTLIDQTIALELGFLPHRFQEVIGVDQQPTERPVFRLTIGLTMVDELGRGRFFRFAEDIVGMPPVVRDEGYVGLLGRDFLRHFDLIYDGPNGRFQLVRDQDKIRRR
jgi:hypothetical protein